MCTFSKLARKREKLLAASFWLPAEKSAQLLSFVELARCGKTLYQPSY
jgi:hypothetical protein